MLYQCGLQSSENWNDQVAEVLHLQHQHFPWLQSKFALLDVLQRACDQTAQWLHDCASTARADMSATAVAVSAAIAAIPDPETIDAKEIITLLERAERYVMPSLDDSGVTGTIADGLYDHISNFMRNWRSTRIYKLSNNASNYDFGAEFRVLAKEWNEFVASTEPQAAGSPASASHAQPTQRAKQAEPSEPAEQDGLQCFVAYRTIERETDLKVPAYVKAMYGNFEERVAHLNEQLDLFSAWFPYPTGSHQCESTPAAQRNKRTHQQMTEDKIESLLGSRGCN